MARKFNCQNCLKEPKIVAYCKTCPKHLCQECAKIHRKWRDFETHNIMPGTPWPHQLPKIPAVCTKHRDMAVTRYCETCSTLLCSKCELCHDNTDTIEDYWRTKRDDIYSELKFARTESTQEYTASISKTIAAVESQHTIIKEKIEEKATEFIEAKKREYLEQAHAMMQGKVCRLEEQMKIAQAVETNSQELTKYTQEILTHSDTADKLANSAAILQGFENLKVYRNQIKKNPEKEANMVYIGTSNTFLSGAVVSLTYTMSGDIRSARVDQQKVIGFTMEAHTSTDIPYNGDVGELTAKLVNVKSNRITECNVIKHQSGFEVTYTPTERGRHTLTVAINEQQLQGSPFPITVQPNIDTLGQPIRTISHRNHKPWGVTTNNRGAIVVAECTSNQVVEFDTEGHCSPLASPFGAQNELQLRGVAVDNDDNTYVVVRPENDEHEPTVYKICSASDGDTKIVTSTQTKFKKPVGICFNRADGKLYVCDQHTVQILGTDLTNHKSIGDENPFEYCIDVAFDSTGNIYVTDYKKSAIRVYNSHKELLRKIENDKFENPYAIAIDSGDHIYVTERNTSTCNNSVHVLTKDGKYLRSFGTSTQNKIKHAWGIHIDQDNFIMVTDDNQIQIY